MLNVFQIINARPEYLTDLYGLDAQPPTMAASFHSLADDIAYLQAEGQPPEHVLEDSPLLTNWSAAFSPLGVILIGDAFGHPYRFGSTARTSPIWVIDHSLKWVRTLNRFYRLGTYVGAVAESQN